MKRFRQLSLVLGLVVSVLLLLVYRNEYVKLRSSFNYLDALSGRDVVLLDGVNKVALDNANVLRILSEPSPQWINIGKHYVYSAFVVPNEARVLTATAVGVGPRDHPIEYECHVWYEVADVLVSSAGRFGFARHQSSDRLSVFEFFCEVNKKDVKGIPYMFVFLHNENGNVFKSFVPIFTPKSSEKKEPGICILPDYVGEKKQSVIEFLAVHHSLGFDNFLMYDNGMHHWVTAKAGEFAQLDDRHLNIVALAWNFPYYDLALNRELVELDCKYRSGSLFNPLAILSINQYLLPTAENSLSDLVANASTGIETYSQVRLPAMVCCVNTKDDKRAEATWPIVLLKTRCERQLISDYIHAYTSTRKTMDLILSSYSTCSDEKLKSTVYDDTAYSWRTKFLTCGLLKMWQSGRLLVNV